jgi:alkylation response protein AidB-like acyl-CoA dehydrogenase
MRFAFSDEQDALRRELRRFLDKRATPADTRRAMASDAGFDADVWRGLVELGLPSLAVPEAHGGAGLGAVEIAAVMEELGRALACTPFFSSACLATPALVLGGDDAQQRAHLPRLAEGARATLAFAGRVSARRDGADAILDGAHDFVVDGHTAELLLVCARENDGAGVWIVEPDAPGVSRAAIASLDPTRKLATVRLEGVRVPASARLPAAGASLVERVLDRARAALAAEQVGGAARCLELSVEYAKTRMQFGRPIGSFQAIKHKCADLLVLVESARSAAYWAAFAAAASEDELPEAAALAQSYCSETFLRAAGETIQIHGGIGFTWEHDAHLYFRRARSSATLLGSAPEARERLARALGL